jgi:hypothetical protein
MIWFSYLIFIFLKWFFCGTGGWTQGLMLLLGRRVWPYLQPLKEFLIKETAQSLYPRKIFFVLKKCLLGIYIHKVHHFSAWPPFKYSLLNFIFSPLCLPKEAGEISVQFSFFTFSYIDFLSTYLAIIINGNTNISSVH